MRRNVWIVVGLLLLALWAWQQRAPLSTAPTTAPTTTPTTAPASAPTTSTLPPSTPRPDAWPTRPARPQREDTGYPAWLPREALATLRDIEQGGPYPHRQDGGVFQNREHRLPAQSRGYYREYTVSTPGSRDRGARRIIAGGDPPVEYFYTEDHYRSFRRFDAARSRR